MSHKLILPPKKSLNEEQKYWYILIPPHWSRPYFKFQYGSEYVDDKSLTFCWQLLAAWMPYETDAESFQRMVKIHHAIRDQPHIFTYHQDVLEIYHIFYQQKEEYEAACRLKRWPAALKCIKHLVIQWENYYKTQRLVMPKIS